MLCAECGRTWPFVGVLPTPDGWRIYRSRVGDVVLCSRRCHKAHIVRTTLRKEATT